MCAYGTDRQPRGAALVIVMLVMAVLLLAGTTFLTISSTESQIALNQRVSAQASLLAEAAIHYAIAVLDVNPSLPDGTDLTGSLGDGNFQVRVTYPTTTGCEPSGLPAAHTPPALGTPPNARVLPVTSTVPV